MPFLFEHVTEVVLSMMAVILTCSALLIGITILRQLMGEGENSFRGGRRQSPHSPLGFLIRAASAQQLGVIRHRPSWPLLVRALSDVHPDVCRVAAASLAAIGEPASLAAILDRLH